MGHVFTPAAVQALCGGSFPEGTDFCWQTVEHFELLDGVMQPCNGSDILPGPGILFTAKLTEPTVPSG